MYCVHASTAGTAARAGRDPETLPKFTTNGSPKNQSPPLTVTLPLYFHFSCLHSSLHLGVFVPLDRQFACGCRSLCVSVDRLSGTDIPANF